MANPQKHKLLIKPLVKNIGWWNFLMCCPLQNRSFSYGVEIENINTFPFSGGKIMNIHIKSGEHKELVHIIDSHFNIPSLNSKEKYKIIFDNVYTHLTEITWLKCYIEAADKGIIDLFQFDVANKEAVSLTLENELGWWQDTLFISSQFERQQLRTNKILVFLTAITLIQGLWGLKEFVRFFWNSLIFLLFSIWHGIISTIHFFSNIKHP